MKVEEELKALILKRFKSVRAFSAAIGIPYSTINNIFSRGVGGTGISTAIPLCRALDIDVDALADEEIKPKNHLTDSLSPYEQKLLRAYRNFNDEGKEQLLDYVDTLNRSGKYKKCDESGVVQEENA